MIQNGRSLSFIAYRIDTLYRLACGTRKKIHIEDAEAIDRTLILEITSISLLETGSTDCSDGKLKTSTGGRSPSPV